MAMMNFMDLYRRRQEQEIPGKPEELPMEKLYSGIGPALGSQQVPAESQAMQAAPEAPQAATPNGVSPAGVAGIQAGTQLLGQLMKSATERRASAAALEQKALQEQSEAERSALSQTQGSKQNALAKLIASYKSALF